MMERIHNDERVRLLNIFTSYQWQDLELMLICICTAACLCGGGFHDKPHTVPIFQQQSHVSSWAAPVSDR